MALTILGSALFGQTTASQSAGNRADKEARAVEVKRKPPAPKAVAKEGVPSPEEYPFDKLINTLAQPGGATTGQANGPVSPTPAGSAMPEGWQPAKDVVLPASAREALNVAQEWMTEKQVPAPGKNGRVLYTFGAGLPVVVCAPLRVCVIELEPGENVVGEPHIGDAVRWVISPATSGQGELLTPMIVIKPKQAGLDTNLLVASDRRAYYFRLLSKPDEYLARVAFSYPEDEAMKWKAHLAQGEQRRKAELEASRISSVESMEDLYFDYRINGGDPFVRPVRVVDDGRKTFIQMPPGTAVREAPVLVVLGPEGKPEMVNYRVRGDTYIVDRLFERGALLLGTGKKQRRAEIIRGTSRKPAKGRKDPYRDIQIPGADTSKGNR
jgi:type IV secretion system protein VirB9